MMPALEPENMGHLPPGALGAGMLPEATVPFLNDWLSKGLDCVPPDSYV